MDQLNLFSYVNPFEEKKTVLTLVKIAQKSLLETTSVQQETKPNSTSSKDSWGFIVNEQPEQHTQQPH